MAKQAEPVRITTAARSHREDIAGRQRRYLISMGIRTACFVLAVVSIGHWFMWVFLLASLLLPYVAVVLANAGGSADTGGPDPFEHEAYQAIEGPRTPEGDAGEPTRRPA